MHLGAGIMPPDLPQRRNQMNRISKKSQVNYNDLPRAPRAQQKVGRLSASHAKLLPALRPCRHQKPALSRLTLSPEYGKFCAVKLATTPEEQRLWMQQWRDAAIALDEVRRDELANLTEEQARRGIRMLLEIPGGWRNPSQLSGLIEQQALFQILRRR